MKRLLLILVLLSFPSFSGTMWAAEPWRAASTQIDSVYPQVEGLYLDLHRNPELSYHEEKTAAPAWSEFSRTARAPWSCCAPNLTPCPSRRKRVYHMPATSPRTTTAAS